MINVGDKYPSFKKKAVVSTEPGKEFAEITSDDLVNERNEWTVIFWWPKDFTFVCPTELVAFNDKYDEFKKNKTNLLGGSTDSEFVHLAWRMYDKKLAHLKYPMIADTSKSLCEALGILTNNDEKVAYRATHIIDPTGTIRWASVNDLSVGRNVDEVLRVLEALQTGGLTPCNWEPGQATINPK